MDTNDDKAGERLHCQSGERDTECTRPVQKRRRYSKAFKREVVEEAMTGKDSVSAVARRRDINTNLLFTWRKQYLLGKYDEEVGVSLIPITVSPMAELAISERDEAPEQVHCGTARVEIMLSGGHRIAVEGAVSLEVLRTALEVLKA